MSSKVAWREWSKQAFDDAMLQKEPVLLSISAVWCHWCHVMDQNTYGNPQIAEFINQHFIPIRVDADRRPDINARYNMGGWPTTAFLSAQGDTLTGGTYIPPENMLPLLREIERSYRENQNRIADRAAPIDRGDGRYDPGQSSELGAGFIAATIAQISASCDHEYGGFGTQPKFPQTDTLEFLLQEYRVTGDPRLYEMVAKAMLGMMRGGMYDHVEGGFFRYSTTRDWSIPHFEKMAEDHAGLLRVLARLFALSKNPAFRETMRSATRYVFAAWRDCKSGLFAGSQDADESYYALPLEMRRERKPPFIDRTSYSNWTAGLAGAIFTVSNALDGEVLANKAAVTLDTLHERMRDKDGLLYHYLELAPKSTPRVGGLLTDQSAYLRALLDAHESTGELRFLERAQEIADATGKNFGAPEGGFYDHVAAELELGNLRFRDRPLAENGWMADSLLRLSAMLDEPKYRELAHGTLLMCARSAVKGGSFAAAYAIALRRYLSPSLSVTISGVPAETGLFREFARALPNPLSVIHCISGGPNTPATARLCVGTVCAPPATEPYKLRESYETIIQPAG